MNTIITIKKIKYLFSFYINIYGFSVLLIKIITIAWLMIFQLNKRISIIIILLCKKRRLLIFTSPTSTYKFNISELLHVMQIQEPLRFLVLSF